MAKYKLKPTYPVEVINPETGKKEIEQRPYDESKIEKYHEGKKLQVGDVIELSPDQLELQGKEYFELVPEKPAEGVKTNPKKEKTSTPKT